MNEEIKTIGQLLDFVETEKKATELINYITNLQEELKYSVSQVQHNQVVSKLSNEKHILQEENQKLKDTIKEAKEKSTKLQEKYDYILDDLTFILARGIDYE